MSRKSSNSKRSGSEKEKESARITIRWSEEERSLLKAGKQVTGLKSSELARECIRRHMPDTIREIRREQNDAAKKFDASYPKEGS